MSSAPDKSHVRLVRIQERALQVSRGFFGDSAHQADSVASLLEQVNLWYALTKTTAPPLPLLEQFARQLREAQPTQVTPKLREIMELGAMTTGTAQPASLG